MSIKRILFKEVFHNRWSFILGVVSVAIATAAFTGTLAVFAVHGARTRFILRKKEEALQERLARMDANLGKAMKALGFNVVILPESQDLAEWHAGAGPDATADMPEPFIERLKSSSPDSLESMVPRFRAKAFWPEKKWTIFVIGTDASKGLLAGDGPRFQVCSVPEGEIVVGHELQRALGLTAGMDVQLKGRKFRISQCLPERGTADDISVWMSLESAQRFFGRMGRISEIVAVASSRGLQEPVTIRREITRTLPETEVVWEDSKIQTMVHARTAAEQEGRLAIKHERVTRNHLRDSRRKLATVLLPAVLSISVVWIWLLSFGNVRGRRREIGLLRALGFRSSQIFMLFECRSFLLATFGGILGSIAGLVLARNTLNYTSLSPGSAGSPVFLVFAGLLLAWIIGGAASCPTALSAARKDPAEMLREDI